MSTHVRKKIAAGKMRKLMIACVCIYEVWVVTQEKPLHHDGLSDHKNGRIYCMILRVSEYGALIKKVDK